MRGEFFAERYGPEAASHAPPIRQILNAGIPVGAGTDATRVASYNPWISLYWMVSGKTVGGLQLASPENRLSREEALRLYTVGTAWFSGEEKIKGRIAPGQFADFAILSDDYMTVPEEQIRKIESVLTVTGGDVVYSADPFTAFAPESRCRRSVPSGLRWRHSEAISDRSRAKYRMPRSSQRVTSGLRADTDDAASGKEGPGLEHFWKRDAGFPSENATTREDVERFPIQSNREALWESARARVC